MSDDSQPNANSIECNLFRSGTNLCVDRHYCTEDANITEDFVGDHEDHDLLTKDTPKANQ